MHLSLVENFWFTLSSIFSSMQRIRFNQSLLILHWYFDFFCKFVRLSRAGNPEVFFSLKPIKAAFAFSFVFHLCLELPNLVQIGHISYAIKKLCPFSPLFFSFSFSLSLSPRKKSSSRLHVSVNYCNRMYSRIIYKKID